jgi:hypothetical protein
VTRRILSVALIVLGAIAILAAIASATIWRPTDTATLSLPTRPDAPVVVSDPGVLDAVAPDVTIEATAGGDEPVVLAVARSADVDAWVGPAAHTRITGLASWEQLEVTDVAAEESTAEATEGATAEPAEPAALPNPAGSDLWVVEQTGTGSAQIDWTDRDGRWSLLAATDGTAPAPEVTLTWPVEVATPWLVPGLILGGLLLIAGIALLVLDTLTHREMRRRAAVAPAGADTDETTVLPATTGATAGLTRRELRERERAAARRGGRGRTGEIPVVATTGEIPVAAPVAPREVDDAGIARGAGIVPASTRSAELRAAREGAEEEPPEAGERRETPPAAADAMPASEVEDAVAASGVSRGAGIVPASDRAAELRAAREPAEASDAADAGAEDHPLPDPETAEWTENEAGEDGATAVLPAVAPEEHPAVRPTAEETAILSSVEEHEISTTEEPAAEPPAAEEPAAEPEGDRSGQGWRSMWGFGRGKDKTDEGKEQR